MQIHAQLLTFTLAFWLSSLDISCRRGTATRMERASSTRLTSYERPFQLSLHLPSVPLSLETFVSRKKIRQTWQVDLALRLVTTNSWRLEDELDYASVQAHPGLFSHDSLWRVFFFVTNIRCDIIEIHMMNEMRIFEGNIFAIFLHTIAPSFMRLLNKNAC